MRLFSPLLFITFLAATLSACNPVAYKGMETSPAKLQGLKTFQWEPVIASDSKNQDAFDQAFREAMTAHLHNKGYVSAKDNADLTVDYRISMIPVEDPAVNNSPGLGWHLDETGEPVYDGWEHPTGMDSLMQRGLVILTLTRNSDESIAWQAGASRKIETEESASTFKSHASKLAAKLGKEIPKAN
ncbi:DUF4136 domain-containing protein [Pseudomaricurvus sp.]|uniref:DUF4136 domain-containing protein n=1 Tax=Pseudomaricurvus sp. TaxID=2004510 RepID=UPI003F6B3FBD